MQPENAIAAWPRLTLDDWASTQATLHRWTQIVGKTRLALAPMQNHWWQVVLYVTSRGLTTSPIPSGSETFKVEFDFIDHALMIRTSEGETGIVPLVARTVADFYADYMSVLRSLGVDVRIRPRPVEVPDATPFPDDRAHASYDSDAAQRCWQVLVHADRALKEFRGKFLGKSSPSHFWWGAFYAYSYPEPAGCDVAPIRPASAYYHPEMHEWILPYESVRASPTPEGDLKEFFQSTYEAAADRAKWDRSALEREPLR